ncbi:TetR/AcrR family transcriptional regulator [Nocardioides luteus]|uniref:TetR/AcrR family transcriptional regulator n=1 Tax=Nocardioides luteus TaxID=1844 RepID=UPI001E4BC89B|nr:TetR/AcrR family transcriptional regulator [Nocardioides luteus]
MNQQRQAQDRTERARKIVRTARRMAEADGWEAVTVRRLADAIEYSQPVLYGHFPDGKAGIAAAVALEGFDELGERIRSGRGRARAPREVMNRLATAYLDFAEEWPATYGLMFDAPTTLAFAVEETPAPMKQAFEEIVTSVSALPVEGPAPTVAEVVWSALHGQATLARNQRLLPEQKAARLRVLVDLLTT